MKVVRSSLYAWVTSVSRIMAGDRSCIWASWFRTKYKDYNRKPSDFNLAQWKVDHTRMLMDFAVERKRQGDQVYVENQNAFKYKRQSGLILAGKPDLIGVRTDDATVYDIKTGKPNASDQLQVMIYMYCLPRCRGDYRDKKLDGCVVYREDQVPIPAEAVDDKFSENLHHFLDMLDADHPALKVPSAAECGFCEITTTDCPERIDAPVDEEETTDEPV